MTYHDTPAQPLPEMQYVDASAKPGEKHAYAVVAVNSVGLKSEPSASIGDAIAPMPQLPGIGAAMQAAMDAREIAGAVTVVVTKDKVLHLEASGLADIAAAKPMQPDSLFWIASMTKPVTAVAVLMLQDEGKLNVADPVAKYIPAFADLKTPSGKPANLTITQILTHTSGLGEAPAAGARRRSTLADLVPLWLAAPMQYEPGAKWQYTQSGINLAARIVEVVSGLSFDAFVQQRIFDPLGMKNTTFYPADGSVVTAYAKNRTTGALDPAPPRADFGVRDRPPLGNGGLYSTGPDYARFCQMLLGGGVLEGKRYLSPAAMKLLTTVQTGDAALRFLPVGGVRQPRRQLRLGHRHVHSAHAARGRRRHALARHVRPRRRLGHAGLDRSRPRRGLHPHGAALEFPQQRRQRRPPGLSTGGRRCAGKSQKQALADHEISLVQRPGDGRLSGLVPGGAGRPDVPR